MQARPSIDPTDTLSVIAVQDLDCIDRAKFRYALPVPIPSAFLEKFADAHVVIRDFSKITPRARDLFSITKAGCFRCDGIVGGSDFIVSFEGDPLDWPKQLMDDFAQRLRESGFAKIDYVRGKDIDCGACSARFEKKCRGFALQDDGTLDPRLADQHTSA